MSEQVVNATPIGVCPYCGSVDLAQVLERRPGQSVDVCNGCGRHSVRALRARGQYPMSDPTDPESSPATSGRM